MGSNGSLAVGDDRRLGGAGSSLVLNGSMDGADAPDGFGALVCVGPIGCKGSSGNGFLLKAGGSVDFCWPIALDAEQSKPSEIASKKRTDG